MFFVYFIITLSLLLILSGLIVLFFLLWSIITLFFTRVPWAPTPKDVIELIFQELDIKPGQKIYDLGCGDARVLIEANKYGADCVGYELSLWVYARAKFKIWLKNSKTKIYRKNFFKQDLSSADIIFCFLLSKVMPKVQKKLKSNLKQNTTIVTYAFSLPNYKPYKILDTKPSKTYFYKM